MDSNTRAELAAASTGALKAGPPTIASGALLFGYPVSDVILWLTLAWWVWLFADKIISRIGVTKKRRRRGD